MSQEQLSRLHALDLELDDLKRRVDAEHQRTVQFRNNLTLRIKDRDQRRECLKTLQVEVRKLELSIEETKTRQHSLEQKILRVVNARELEALTREIAGLKTEIESLEERLLAKYEAVEQHEANLAGKEKTIRDYEGGLVKLAEEVKTRVSSLEEQVSVTATVRGEVAKNVMSDLLSRYEKARERHGGQVLFEVRENGCEGCGLVVPGFEWNRFKQNPGTPYECSNCGRLLVYVGEPS